MLEVPHFALFFIHLLFHLSMLTLPPEHPILEYLQPALLMFHPCITQQAKSHLKFADGKQASHIY
jgi:hypothetical protein